MRIDVPRLLLVLGIEAKRNGREWAAVCPLPGHADTKPSWSIRDQEGTERHGRHHCFSCKQGGTPAGLVRDVLGLESFADAHRWMHENGITSDPDLPVEVNVVGLGGARPDERQIKMPLGVVFAPLHRWVSSARDYVVNVRGVTEAQVEKWGLGYAIDGRLIGRIVVPIRDEEGVLLSYTARSYRGSEIRYLTPKRDEGSRTDAVFGMAEWRERKRLVVTEGAFNALACERAGALEVGALGGSEVTPTVIAEVSTFEEIDIFADSDAAGDSVALQLYYALARWRKVRRLGIAPVWDPVKGKMRKRDANDLTEAELREILRP